MRNERVTIPERSGADWKGLGYLVSIASVFFLGAVAWPQTGDPSWMAPALIVGMAASIIGMGLRYIAHRQQEKELKRARAEARST